MIKKWKLLSSEMVLDEKWYRVRRDVVEVEPGKVVDDYYLKISNDIVLIVAVTDKNEIPLVRQYKHGAGEILVELPAGYIDDGEEPLEAAQRELREETGFAAESWHELGVFYKNSAKTSGDRVRIYLALQAKEVGGQELDENEKIEVLLTDMAKVQEVVWSGKMTSGDSVLAILLAARKMAQLAAG